MIKIENLNKDNMHSALELRRKALTEEPLAFHMYEDEDRLFPDEEHIQNFLDKYGKGIFLAIEGNVMVGMARGYIEEYKLSTHNGWITSFYVDPNYRGKGIGKDLMRSVLRFLGENGNVRNAFLNVTNSQNEARALYRNFGFVEVGKLPNCFQKDGIYYDQLIMARAI